MDAVHCAKSWKQYIDKGVTVTRCMCCNVTSMRLANQLWPGVCPTAVQADRDCSKEPRASESCKLRHIGVAPQLSDWLSTTAPGHVNRAHADLPLGSRGVSSRDESIRARCGFGCQLGLLQLADML